jgi:SAM-dependent methyltransferase
LQSVARYRPWPFLEAAGATGATCVYDDLPEIPAERVAWIRRQLNWPERSGPGFDGGEYHALATDYIGSDDDVLDAGCGHGQITSILDQHGRSATGVDYDSSMIDLARSRFPDIEFEAADLQSWNRPGAFDVIFHCHTLEHLPDAVATLANLRTSLKPGGRIVVEVPLELRPGIINPHHEREYTVDGLLDEVARAGLRVVETRGVSRGIYVRADQRREAFVAVCADAGSTDV